MFKLIMSYTLLLIATIVSFVGGDSFAQTDYIMSIVNDEKINDNTIEFDVFIRSALSTFVLTSYQCSFAFNQHIINNGNLSFSYIPQTSELDTLIPATSIGLVDQDGYYFLTFASLPGNETISTTGKKVGRFRLTNSNIFTNEGLNIKWGIGGYVPTLLTGNAFSDITNRLNHVYSYDNGGLVKFPIINVDASATTDQSTSPEGTIDGFGFYDNIQTSRWAADPMPQWIQFDLGTERQIGLTKFSFYNFQLGRIYQYSISVSNDGTNWSQFVSNASSLAEEWSVDTCQGVVGRYVKLEILSSTNNPENWANLWEAEIWGTAGITSADENEKLPEHFSLEQNYPNPFNPSTKIKFTLREKSQIILTVFNVLGEKVIDLLNSDLNAGYHSIDFNASELPSGIYFYRLVIPNKYSEVKKMLLIK
jgi:hypothetical protein